MDINTVDPTWDISGLGERERLTLADAIDAYRSVRGEDREWMRLPVDERMSPHQLDRLRDALLEGIDGAGQHES